MANVVGDGQNKDIRYKLKRMDIFLFNGQMLLVMDMVVGVVATTEMATTLVVMGETMKVVPIVRCDGWGVQVLVVVAEVVVMEVVAMAATSLAV